MQNLMIEKNPYTNLPRFILHEGASNYNHARTFPTFLATGVAATIDREFYKAISDKAIKYGEPNPSATSMGTSAASYDTYTLFGIIEKLNPWMRGNAQGQVIIPQENNPVVLPTLFDVADLQPEPDLESIEQKVSLNPNADKFGDFVYSGAKKKDYRLMIGLLGILIAGYALTRKSKEN